MGNDIHNKKYIYRHKIRKNLYYSICYFNMSEDSLRVCDLDKTIIAMYLTAILNKKILQYLFSLKTAYCIIKDYLCYYYLWTD